MAAEARVEGESHRWLIVTADDLGASRGVNLGVRAACKQGIVTSASLLVHGCAAEDGATTALGLPDLALGLHVDLGEWVVVDGEWAPRGATVDDTDDGSVSRAVAEQLNLFRELVGSDPTHLDSHQHVHRREPTAGIVRAWGARLGVPVRDVEIPYCGAFYGQSGRGDPYLQGISVDHLVALIRNLPAGLTELGCHPGFAEDLESTYRDERRAEVEALCAPEVRRTLNDVGVTLLSFSDPRVQQWRTPPRSSGSP